MKKSRVKNPLNRILRWYFSKNALPYWCIFALDGIILVVSGILSYWLFNRFHNVLANIVPLTNALIINLLVSAVGVRIFHTYAGVIRYASIVDLVKIGYANMLSLGIMLLLHIVLLEYPVAFILNLGVIELVSMYLTATLMMWAVRILVKALYDVSLYDKVTARALIYGAMNGGVGLAKNIQSQKPAKYVVKGFISHDSKLKHNRLMGEKVYSKDDDFLWIIEKENIDVVLVPADRVNELRMNQTLLGELMDAGVKILMSQKVMELGQNDRADKDSNEVNLREVSVEDLLPREEIEVDMKSVGELLTNRKILVTGAAGSIGSEMVRQIALYNPSDMILIDQAETPQHDIRLMMERTYPGIKAETIVASVNNQERMEMIFREFRPDYVFHAAGYKHVPMMEDNPSEAICCNVLGTKILSDLSVKYGVKKFVMVSTDKAVNPTNVMGCSKRICEIYVQALDRSLKVKKWSAKSEKPVTQFVTTRFGNVLGSNGSVIPLFKEQIKRGGPVTVTDSRIVRYFMLIPEACKLVLEAGTKGNGGEIFVFDMGEPVRIADLAERMIRLSGAKNVKIQYTGLREGEKLYEEVLNDKESTKPTFHQKIRIAKVREQDYDQISKEINELITIARQYNDMATVKKMKEIVPEYKSANSVYSVLDEEAKEVKIS